MTASSDRAGPAFIDLYGHSPTLVWAAPGRVNLIGEHTDYNEGFVLPFALPLRTVVAVGPATRPEWTVWSETTGETVTFGVDDLAPGSIGGWAAYVAGVVWALRTAGVDVPAAHLAVTSDVPSGAGLSSSAALECAVLAAMVHLAGAADDVPAARWPLIAQQAENTYVGVPSGIMDQSAATLSRDGHALFLDCRTLESDHVAFALSENGLAVLIIDTRAPHRHASGEYAVRRATCEAAARTLGVPALRDVTDLTTALAFLADDLVRRRVRHVVSENERVLQTVARLRAGHTADIGPLLSASHASLRDDYEVSAAELDLAVEAAEAAGALGARMTGGGFGGCAIALVATTRADDVADAIGKAFASRGIGAPATFLAAPSRGAAQIA